jgi:uncharacterized protein (DUF885 family)
MELVDEYLDQFIKINPTFNDYLNNDKYLKLKSIQPNIYSEPYYKKLFDLDKKYHDRLKNVKQRDFYQEILFHDLKHNIKMETGYEIYMYMPVNNYNNLLIDYVTDCRGDGNYLFKNENDYLCFMKRLKSLDDICNTIIEKMKNGIKNKVTLYKKTTDKMIENINNILKLKSYRHKKKHKLTDKLNKKIDKYLVLNLERFLIFLRDEYYEHVRDECGLHSYKGGKSAYREIIKNFTFHGLTPEIVQKIGYSEIKRLQKEKKKLQTKLGYKDIDDYVKNESSFYFSNKKDIIDELKRLRKNIYKNVFQKRFHPSLKESELYNIKSIPDESSGIAYYVPPPIGKKEKGSFYINTKDPSKINKYELYVLSLHEGIPGHHYETYIHDNDNEVPDIMKLISFTGYVEGWGLYSESLGDYKDDLYYYYRIMYDLHRSVRLVIDTGIHYFGWKYDKCFDFMKENLVFSDDYIHTELLRYIDIPGQAITYKIGEKTFLYLKEKLLKRGLSEKNFHEVIMKLGPSPLSSLVENLK